MPFFDHSACADPMYVSVRDRPQLRWGRRYTETLWSLYRRYADTNFLREASLHFHERFWEMYVGVAFLRTGLPVTKSGDTGPEFAVKIGARRFWVEAAAPSAGDGPERVPEEPDDDAGIVPPTDKILLRFTHCLLEKQRKRDAAVAKGIIGIDDGYILAINSRAIPHAAFGHVPPFPVRAFLPFGQQYLRYDILSGTTVESGFARRNFIEKANNSQVSTAAFLDPSYSWVSAVLHSAVDPINFPRRLGHDFELIHNPSATPPLPPEPFNKWPQWSFDISTSQLAYYEPPTRNRG